MVGGHIHSICRDRDRSRKEDCLPAIRGYSTNGRLCQHRTIIRPQVAQIRASIIMTSEKADTRDVAIDIRTELYPDLDGVGILHFGDLRDA